MATSDQTTTALLQEIRDELRAVRGELQGLRRGDAERTQRMVRFDRRLALGVTGGVALALLAGGIGLRVGHAPATPAPVIATAPRSAAAPETASASVTPMGATTPARVQSPLVPASKAAAVGAGAPGSLAAAVGSSPARPRVRRSELAPSAVRPALLDDDAPIEMPPPKPHLRRVSYTPAWDSEPAKL